MDSGVCAFLYLCLIFYISAISTSCPTELHNTIDISNGIISNDTITYQNIEFTSDIYFYYQNRTYGCVCQIKTCLPKCCAEGERYFDRNCKPSDKEFDITLYMGTKTSDLNMSDFYLLPTTLKGNSILRVTEEYYIEKNGDLYTSFETFTDPTTYCFEGNENSELVIYVYLEQDTDGDIMTTTYIGMIISMPFLLATFLVYALLPDRNLPAKALMCYVLSLLFAYIFLVTIQLNAGHKATTCISLAFFCYYFFMASFFWMNASCLDIFFTFSGIRGLLGDKKKEHKRFAYYSAYAWGMPLLMVGFASIFTFAYTDANNSFYTGLGERQCWFIHGWTTGIYFYFPIAILLIVNMVLFGVTTYKIKRVQKDTKMLKNVDSRKHKYDNNDKQRFNLYVKLLFAMGINWSMEVISWAIKWKWANVPDYVWVLTDFCNAVYGVLIFFIFVFKRNIWMLLKKRYLQLTGRPQQAHNLTSTHRTTVSQVSSSEA